MNFGPFTDMTLTENISVRAVSLLLLLFIVDSDEQQGFVFLAKPRLPHMNQDKHKHEAFASKQSPVLPCYLCKLALFAWTSPDLFTLAWPHDSSGELIPALKEKSVGSAERKNKIKFLP